MAESAGFADFDPADLYIVCFVFVLRRRDPAHGELLRLVTSSDHAHISVRLETTGLCFTNWLFATLGVLAAFFWL
jgi:hypothetical protein